MRAIATFLAVLTLLLAATPLAAASTNCGNPPAVGLVPWTLCEAKYAEGEAGQVVGQVDPLLCFAWDLVWGPNHICPFPE